MADRRDYYDTLGVGRTSSQEEIKRSFRRLARRHHPDVNPNDSESEARFKEIAEAYEVLGDPERRAMYDQFGHAAPTGAMVGDFWDDLGGFGDLFEAFFGGRRAATRPRRRRGADLRYDLAITLEEVASGVERSIEAKRLRRCAECEGTGSQSKSGGEDCGRCGGSGQVRQMRATPIGQFTTVGACPACGGSGVTVADPCPKCEGQGRRVTEEELSVTIPAGVEDGVSLRIEGEGEAGERGAPPGDLYVVVHAKEHEVFQRRGRELLCEMPIAFTTAALGGKVMIPTLEGTKELTIPAGTQTGERLVVRDRGLPDMRTGVRGSIHVVVRVATPRKLTERQRELLGEFAQEGGDQVEDEKGWFSRLREALRGEN